MSQLLVLPNQIQEKMLKMMEGFFPFKVKPLKVKGYKLDPGEQKLIYGDIEVNLRRREFDLVHFMLINHGSIIDRNTILDRVWGLQSNPFTNTVDVHMSHLRRKLVKNNIDILKTIHGVGYRLEI
ncbi:hypothetical protein C0416_02005 [bacterium]|nr:hypothetical protein [bacterium]